MFFLSLIREELRERLIVERHADFRPRWAELLETAFVVRYELGAILRGTGTWIRWVKGVSLPALKSWLEESDLSAPVEQTLIREVLVS